MSLFDFLFGDMGLIISYQRRNKESAADRLIKDAHILHCKERICCYYGDMLRQRARPEYLALCERFHHAKPAIKFRAMMENLNLKQIKSELDKAETKHG
jgi:hypothetical protein